jgi:hypothetical protein
MKNGKKFRALNVRRLNRTSVLTTDGRDLDTGFSFNTGGTSTYDSIIQQDKEV